MFFTKMKYFNLVLALFIAFSPATAISSKLISLVVSFTNES